MMKSIFIFLIAFSFLFGSIVTNQVSVDAYSPKSLQEILKRPEAKFSIANYGFVPYGKSLIGTIIFASPRNACSPLQPIHYNITGHDSAKIVLVERGGCSFVTKTHYAQMLGAQLVLIADNRDEDEDYVIIVDDGTGGDVSIPTIMMSKFVGDWISAYNKDHDAEPIVLSIKFSLPPPVHNINYELWVSALDSSSYSFIRNMKDYHFSLGNRVKFTPHYVIWFCSPCRYQNYSTPNENCVSGGRYCSPDPDLEGPLTGKNVIMEDLRQICIYKSEPSKWWDYMINFEDCYNKSQSLTLKNLEACSKEKLELAKINQTSVDECVARSFAGPNHDLADNSLLAYEKKLFYEETIQLWPSLRINNMSFRGNMGNAEGVMEAICNEFDEPPTMCRSYVENNRVSVIAKQNDGSKLSAFAIILIIILSVSIFMVIVLCIYRRMLRKEIQSGIQSEVSMAINRYYSLNADGAAKAPV